VGTDSFTYKASDGLLESAAATVSIAVLDRKPPETTIDSGPTGTIKVRTASFGFSSKDDDLERFECSLNGLDPADFGACTSPENYSDLTDGEHTFRVRAVDASGNADATPAVRAFAVDATVPSAPKITSPANRSYDADGSFAIKGTAEAGSTVKLYEIVKLSDGTVKKVFKGADTSGTSGSWGTTLSGVANGKHSYKATATDKAGNVSAASATRTITVDKIRPQVKSVSPANKTTGVSPTANVTATFSEAMKASTLNRLTFTLVRKGTT
jgi:hypothetical protein